MYSSSSKARERLSAAMAVSGPRVASRRAARPRELNHRRNDSCPTTARSKNRHGLATLGVDASTRLLSLGRGRAGLRSFDERESPFRDVHQTRLPVPSVCRTCLFCRRRYATCTHARTRARTVRSSLRKRRVDRVRASYRRCEENRPAAFATRSTTSNYQQFRVSCSPQLH